MALGWATAPRPHEEEDATWLQSQQLREQSGGWRPGRPGLGAGSSSQLPTRARTWWEEHIQDAAIGTPTTVTPRTAEQPCPGDTSMPPVLGHSRSYSTALPSAPFPQHLYDRKHWKSPTGLINKLLRVCEGPACVLHRKATEQRGQGKVCVLWKQVR